MKSSCGNTDSSALIPPHQIEAEQALLGGCLIEGVAPADVGADDWYWDSHRIIAEAMGACVAGGSPVDLITVAERLEAAGQLDATGGAPYLVKCVESVPSAENAPTYAKIIRDKARARRVFNLCLGAPARLCNGRPPDVVIAEIAAELHEAGRDPAARAVDLGTATKAALATIEDRMNAGGKSRALSATSGVTGLDAITNGFTREEFTVVAARPSLGKTALLLQSAFAAAKAGARVHFFSLEMSTYSLLCRLLSQESGIEGSRLRRGAVTVQEYVDVINAARAFFGLDFVLDDTSGLTVVDIVDRVRRTKPDAVYVDYLGILKPHKREANREREVSVMSRVLHGIAKELHCSVVVAVQLNRESEKGKREPCLADLRESGAIEQDADVVVFVHAKDKGDDYRDLIVAKNRNGRVGRCRTHW